MRAPRKGPMAKKAETGDAVSVNTFEKKRFEVKSAAGFNNIEKAIENSAKSAKEGRLIVRNIGFNVKVEQLRERFADFGELIDAVLPPSKLKAPEESGPGNKRVPPHAGYGFVEFDTREQAQAAITAVNGSRIGGRQVAVDFAFDARLYKAIRDKNNKTGPKPSVSVQPAQEAHQDDSDNEESADVTVATPTQSSTPAKRGPSSDSPVPKKKQRSTEPEDDRKLFLLNVPFEATKTDIAEALLEYAKVPVDEVELVLFVKDKSTDKPSGKAFVIFSTKESASKVLEMESSAAPQLFGDLYRAKSGKAATAPLEGAGCVVLGRRIAILKPLSKIELEKQKLAKEEEKNPKNPKLLNKKHIDFVNAGWIGEGNDEVWSTLSPHDQKLRTACNEEKKFKLKNANFVINRKRLMIRNLPKRMENGDLMAAILKAMQISGPNKLKQAGIDKVAIVKDKMTVAVGEREPKQANFDMEGDNTDDDDKAEGESQPLATKEKKRSRGFAFVDFVDSEKAMQCLEAMNNVPGALGEMGGADRRPIVEFSFDDVRKLQIQQQRLVKQHARATAEAASNHPVEKTAAAVPVKAMKAPKGDDKKQLSRGQRQRLRRREMRANKPKPATEE